MILLSDDDYIGDYEGQKVVVEGRISQIPWQHLIAPSDSHPVILYLDSGKNQIVIYSKRYITCTEKIKTTGTVIKIEGKSKKTGSDEIFSEYQIVVDEYECIE